jgi:hypothetical protein
MKAIIAIVGLVTVVMSLPAGAADANQQKQPRRVNRLQNQTHAIRKQFANGNLTAEEADQLRQEQRNIKKAIKTAGSDGSFTAEEKARIEALQDKARARITLQSTDNQEGSKKNRATVRQFSEKERIKDGVADGTLTKDEAKGLRDYIKANAQMIKGAKADGTLTDEEKKRIEARQDILSADIYLKRHNDANRGPASDAPASTAPASTAPASVDTTAPASPDVPANAGFVPAESTY